jgi:uncharacterized membrane protein YeaQ/YmgE (transglycosylase-associated protein family)
MVIVSIFGWVVVGIIVGFIASKFVDLHGDDIRFGMAAAVAGAVVAAVLHAVIKGVGLDPWQPWGAIFAAVGATIGATAWHVIRARSITHDRGTERRSY